MTEYASHHRDDRRRQSSRSSSSNVSISKSMADTWSDSRILAQPMDKIEDCSKAFTSINKEIKRDPMSALVEVLSCKEKSNSLFLDDYKILRKSEIRPSDSSYTRKLPWDASNSAEIPFRVHSSKSHQTKDVKQDCHVANKHFNRTITDNHMNKLDSFYGDKRKASENNLNPPPLYTHLSEIGQVNGISHDSHSNSLPFFVDPVTGYCHPASRASSHLQSHGNNLLSTSHKRCPDLEKKSFSAQYRSPTRNRRSPALNYVSYGNPKDEYSTATSQKMAVSEESSSRPNSSFCGEEEYSNDDKSLAVNFSDPITNSGNTVTATPEKSRYPYSIEMKEGMFKAVKVGPVNETLKIHIIENFGSGDLRDGGFSWGWSIERRSSAQPPAKTCSASKEKNHSSANKDVHKTKRRLEYEKSSSSPSPKKAKVKGSSSDIRDTKSNREKSSTVSVEAKEIKRKSNSPKHSSPYIKPNSMSGVKSSVKSSKSCHGAPAVAEKSPGVGRSLNSDKLCRLAVSPVERRKSPFFVPSTSEMIPNLPKTDCLGKHNNSVIDVSTMGFISSKKERSAVYSGKKSALEVQPLKVMCFEYVKKNILGLKIGENVPFELLMPALKLCSPSKLHKVEDHNRHILRRTDCLWKKFCETEFRDQKRVNGEAWKDVYWRARNLREKKLKNLAASISNGMAKAHPERQAKWVGVSTNNPEKRQRKIKVEEVHKPEVHRTEEIPIPRPEANGKGSGSSSTQKQPSSKKRSESESSSSNSPQFAPKPPSLSKNQVTKAPKKTLAPLMSKTKKMLNLVNRRR